MQKPIVVVGSINMDLVASAEYIPSVGETIKGTGFQFQPGGKGANQAVAVAKLGYPVRMVVRWEMTCLVPNSSTNSKNRELTPQVLQSLREALALPSSLYRTAGKTVSS